MTSTDDNQDDTDYVPSEADSNMREVDNELSDVTSNESQLNNEVIHNDVSLGSYIVIDLTGSD